MMWNETRKWHGRDIDCIFYRGQDHSDNDKFDCAVSFFLDRKEFCGFSYVFEPFEGFETFKVKYLTHPTEEAAFCAAVKNLELEIDKVSNDYYVNQIEESLNKRLNNAKEKQKTAKWLKNFLKKN